MANITLKTTAGKATDVFRAYTPNADLTSTLRLPPTKVQLGINQSTTSSGSTELDFPIPYTDGVVNDDGANTFTGTSGGDNSTDNTVRFKPGANLSDDTAQNLIANGTNASKVWTIANLATAGIVVDITKRLGFWVYILDQTTLDKFLTSGTALEFRIGSDASNYYSKTYTAALLTTGWNWLGSNKDIVSSLTETGTVGATVDYFEIIITTNNAADAFIAGDVVYDLLRSWDEADTKLDFDDGYPTIDTATASSTIEVSLTLAQANGFDISGAAFFNEDTSPILHSIHEFSGKSKTDTEEFKIKLVDRHL